jgi:RHS repeat-associated protein
MIYLSNFHNRTHPIHLVLGSPKAQGVDFRYAALRHPASIIFNNKKERYNTRDWLIRINNYTLLQSATSQDNNDRFGINIGYDQHEWISWWLGGTPQCDGNISWVMYRLHGVEYSMWGYPTERVGYVYRYDKANRLTRGEFAGELYGDWYGGNAYNERDITYHKNGNITVLKRYNQSGSLMHNYTYTYYSGTNRLRRVTGSGDRYVYDSNGNVRHDLDNNIGFVIYDIFKLPVTIYTTGGAEHRYYYDHNGNRIRKRIGGSSDYYVNGIDGRTEVVTNNTSSWATYNIYGLDHIGQIRRDSTIWNRFYFLKDHLGSIKVVVNASGNRVAHTDMYPFGYEMPGRVQGSSSVDGRYKFTGKERDTETSYDYFGARYYDARIGRWLIPEPLLSTLNPKELIHKTVLSLSPYQYVRNNPIRRIDVDGYRDKDTVKEGVIWKAAGVTGAVAGTALIISTGGVALPLVGLFMLYSGSLAMGVGTTKIVAGLQSTPDPFQGGGINEAILREFGVPPDEAKKISLILSSGELALTLRFTNPRNLRDIINFLLNTGLLSVEAHEAVKRYKEKSEEKSEVDEDMEKKIIESEEETSDIEDDYDNSNKYR